MSSSAAIQATTPRYYARVSRRLQASLVDSVVYLTSPAVLLLIASLIGGSALAAQGLVIGWLVALVLYEPLLVTLRGATIGHAVANIRVVDARTGRPPVFWRAFVRFIVKGVLGIFSFVLVVSTERRQAAHDLVAGTTVEIRELWRMRPGDYLEALVRDPRAVPAPLTRRGLITAGYSAVWVALVAIMYFASRSERCLIDGQCTRAETLTGVVLLTGWLGGQALCLVAGFGGRLPGARPSIPTA